MFRRLAFFAMLATSAGLSAQPAVEGRTIQTSRLTMEEAAGRFGAREGVQHADISPDGSKIAFIGPAEGRISVAYVADLNNPGTPPRPIARSSGDPDRLRWCRFVTNDRLICRFTAVIDQTGVLVPFARLIAIDTDGGNVRELGQRQSFDDSRVRQFDGQIVDWTSGREGTILMSREYVPEVGLSAGTHLYRRDDGLAVDQIDVRTMRSSRVERPNRAATGYIGDGRGNVRIMSTHPVRGATGQLSARTEYFYRLPGSREWQPFGRFDQDGSGMYPLGIDADLNAAYILQKLNGRYALYRVKLDGSMASELVYANAEVDVDGVVWSSRGDRVIGVSFAEEARRIIYFDSEYSALARDLSGAIPHLPLIDFVGSSSNRRKILIHAGAGDDPGRYYVFDRSSRNLAEIMLVRPQLEHVPLASVRPITYSAADGTSIPGYLTLPPGAEGRNLPAIVLPHGGPSARDEWNFDWLAQYLAHLGYAVLQPNYRGSSGYGDAWLQENGFRSWRTSIGDVTAGARWLVSQGIADPQRMAIVGWSYGGYAALQAAATEPDLFKAAVAIAPVTDLRQLVEEGRAYTSGRNLAEYIGTGAHLTEGSPQQNAVRITAPVLLFHGTRDLNVDVAHSRRMDERMRAAQRQSQLTIFEGLEHGLEDSSARSLMLRRIGEFLATRLGGTS